MDDMKLYARSERDSDSLSHTTRIDSQGNIADIEDSYPLAQRNNEDIARKAGNGRSLQPVRQVLRSQLNGKNNLQAISTYALLVIKYSTGIINWLKEEIEATDIRTKKPPYYGWRVPPQIQQHKTVCEVEIGPVSEPVSKYPVSKMKQQRSIRKMYSMIFTISR